MNDPDSEIKRARKRAMNLLMKMDRTEADVRSRLERDGYSVEAVDDSVAFLKEHKYLDDMRYACEYIRFKSQSMSRRQIEMKLARKGVDNDIIRQAYDGYEDYNGVAPEQAQHDLIRKLIYKRCPDGVSSLDYTARQKLFAYLYGKGFSLSDIEEVYNNLPDSEH